MTSSNNSPDCNDYTALCSAITLQSHKEGFFQQILSSITSLVDENWLRDFGELKSNTERIHKCLTSEKVIRVFKRQYNFGIFAILDNIGTELLFEMCSSYQLSSDTFAKALPSWIAMIR